MVLGWPSASLEITFVRCHKLLVRAFNFLPDATVVHRCGRMTRAALLAFSAISALFGATTAMLGALSDPHQRSQPLPLEPRWL
jgi:hypothetical protein